MVIEQIQGDNVNQISHCHPYNVITWAEENVHCYTAGKERNSLRTDHLMRD